MLSDEGLVKMNPLKVDVKDMTGAGDVFGAAFLTRYMATRDILESIEICSGRNRTENKVKGPTGFPSEAEILEAMKKL